MSSEFAAYADKLRALIEKPESRMLLKASEYGPVGERKADAAFQLTSGAFLTEFITLWELFDHRREFKEFIAKFAEKAQEIHQENPYAAIVTATATSKHILEHAHALIEGDRYKISVHYLGDYPFLDAENRKLLDFRGENVLIVTDVIATGSLVAKMAEIVEEVAGRPIGVLCAALIGPELIDNNSILEFGQGQAPERPKKQLRIHSLTTRRVHSFKVNGGPPPSLIFKIDAVTILPEDKLLLPNGFYPKFDDVTMFAHFESAKAIDFDFYTMDDRRLTTAIRIKPLLDTCGPAIWAAIEPKVRDAETLVTTFQRDDVLFKEFVEDRFPTSHPSFVFIPKRNSLESPNSYFLLPTQLEQITGKRIVLLLAQIFTSERLRNIVSLLVSNGAESISVICLLNRMGMYTSSFISRLERLVRGVGQAGGTIEHTGFEFLFLYSLPDISGDDLKRMQETIRALFDYYTSQTRIPSFRRSMLQDLKYFQSHSVTSHQFENPTATDMSSFFPLAISDYNLPILVRSCEGRLALLSRHLVASRDFDQFIKAIGDRSVRDKETLYKIFGILLTDLSYLKLTGRFARLRETLIDEIRQLRWKRLDLEGRNPAVPAIIVEQHVDVETHLLFGMALFSYLDYEFDYSPVILEILTCGLSGADWTQRPLNFGQYYADERLAWCLSMLMHLSRHDFRQPRVARELKERLIDETETLLTELGNILSGDRRLRDAANTLERIKANLNMLLTDLGAHDLTEKHQVIRFLHSKVIALKRGHNPIHTSLDAALLSLQKIAAENPSERASPVKRRINVSGTPVKKNIEDATYTAGILEEIAEAVRQMTVFAPTSKENGGRYASEPRLPGFSEDVKRLGDLFQKIRVENQVSLQEIQELTQLRNQIAFDLWDPASHLRQMLLRYIVPLREVVDGALITANTTLRDLGFGEVWEEQRKKLSAWPHEWKVLMERHLLREVLRNIFSNVRHAFAGSPLEGGTTYADRVRLDIAKVKRPAPDLKTEERDYFELTVVSFGEGFGAIREDATFSLHQREVTNFASQLEISPLPSQRGTIVKLTLMMRQGPPQERVSRGETSEDDLL
jgi:orotate phosphoribosyltransferase